MFQKRLIKGENEMKSRKYKKKKNSGVWIMKEDSMESGMSDRKIVRQKGSIP